MFHVDNPTGVPVMPPVAAELSKTTLYFTEGGNGIPPTYPGSDWFNIIQSELLEILRQANIKPDKNTTNQIMTALKKLFITNSGSAGAIAGLTGQNNTFPYFTGEDTMALTPLSAFVRGILGKTTANEIIDELSLRDTVNKANRAVPNTRKVNGMALSSDITINSISGNAGTATRLQSARRINNVLFDGTRDITINTTDTGAVRNFQYTNEVFYDPGSTTITWRFRAPSGCQLSGIYVQDTGKNTADNIGGVYYKQAQIYINGAWRSVSG
ncbi:phage tail protein [Escherichia coli]|uniref:phage tail protein n=1 Tax=Escherichia coli TaxID=562 RepID=UPI00137539F8|nr:phage tail protein [Escherichia coli]MBZ9527435.1 phage tail protein [Escherichia coli]MCQ0074159.1 phage tail protein [Escherichia coli]MCQ0084849.1 phage tail protein [Escherichia coli]MCQ0089879.1 phage tail protein [Escherichia coli]MCQ0159604.1 phage tail protein [Escherichia coli]